MEVEAYDRCTNCHREFADHDYVQDSINEYRCPVDNRELVYGYFCGGDPREFFPDRESCTSGEIANHKAACELWDDAESKGEVPKPEECPSGWIYHEQTGERIAHVLRAPYGIGCYAVEHEQFWEPAGTIDPVGDDDLII